ncbi:hypothetical protein Pint_27757 [Pistacia integerrima]|uniref:Uncharacterized protein n=1 Tax=Pistacia integerrima TaxID=434235 RepID=A0ACC0YT55_9ROSI|nr:hypothetical protein Pint_27757 [Pistacia integerrima]
MFLLPSAASVSFQITRFDNGRNNLLYEGDAKPNVGAVEFNSLSYICQVGRVKYAEKVPLWNSETRQLADFTNHFSFIIDTQNKNASAYAAGLAFFLAPVGFEIPPNSAGGFLGLFNTTTSDSSQNQIVLVEFDTFPNEEWDPEFQHVGINTNSISSANYTYWNASLHSGDTAEAWIIYNATTKTLNVSWIYSSTSSSSENSSLSLQVDLMEVLPEWVTIGFSAATSYLTERHQLLTWEFSSSLDVKEVSKGKDEKKIKLAIGLIVSLASLLAGTLGYMAPEYIRTGKASKESDVYSFGMVVLEIATGRRSVDPVEQRSQMDMVEWIWDLYGTGSLLSAADERLENVFDAEQVNCSMIVGLWCAHPDCNIRPSIRQAIQALQFEAAMPNLPVKMPVPIYHVPTHLASPAEPLLTDTTLAVSQ